MDRSSEFHSKKGVYRPLPGYTALTFKGGRDNRQVEMALAARLRVHASLMVMPGVSGAIVLNVEPRRRQG